MKTVIILIVVFFNIGFAQLIKTDTLETVSQNLITEIAALTNELTTIKDKNKQFVINGYITEVTEHGEATIWGSAIPIDLNTLTPEFTSEGYIIVLNPIKECTHLDAYVHGYHYYKGTKKGMKYFGDLPPEVKATINEKEDKIESLTNEITSVKNNIFRLKGEESLRKAERLYTETKYSESINELNNTKKFPFEEQIINHLLYKNYVGLIKESQATKNYNNIFSLIDTAVEILNLSEEQYQFLKTVHFSLCIYIADSCYKNNLFDEAIAHYDNAEKHGFNLSIEERERIASIYFEQGKEQLKLNNIDKSRMRFISAIYFNKKLSGVIYEHLNNKKDSKFLYTSLSIILPGMGLVAQGEDNGFLYLGISTLAAVAAYVSNKEAINTPENDLYHSQARYQRDRAITIRDVSLSVFAIAYVWGIINTVNYVDEYNRKYDLSFNVINNKLNFSMKLNL